MCLLVPVENSKRKAVPYSAADVDAVPSANKQSKSTQTDLLNSPLGSTATTVNSADNDPDPPSGINSKDFLIEKKIILVSSSITYLKFLGSKHGAVTGKKRERAKSIRKLDPKEYQLITDPERIKLVKESRQGRPLLEVKIGNIWHSFTKKDPSKRSLGQNWQCSITVASNVQRPASERRAPNKCSATVWEEFGKDGTTSHFYQKIRPAHRCQKKVISIQSCVPYFNK